MKTRMLFAVLFLLCFSITGISQEKFYTKTGKITFFSAASLENIEAVNRSVTTVLNTKTGDLQFSVLMKGFEFKKALMQEHFNDKYVESDKFPKASFNGTITNNSSINYTVNGSYPANVKGKLTIHGITKDIETKGTIVVKDGKVTASAVFMVLVADYNITIPKLYRDNIAKSIKVTVDCSLSPL
jgi:polyisoprenoid-binding protein YceI